MIAALLLAAMAFTAELPAGAIVDRVTCTADPSRSYALYLPAGYRPDRSWPVIFGFDPGGRGRNPVERYREAAERYGYIVVGSNDSRNGSDEIGQAVSAMTRDVLARFNIDRRRMYTAGMSGGSRVALGVALDTGRIAGVFASSAGYPDGKSRKTLPFPVFATAGTEDFNHLEMRELDRDLTSPHHLAIFEGGHQWLSSSLALEAVEWMEIQAMKSGIESRNTAEIDDLFAKRTAAAANLMDKDAYLALSSIAADFDGLKDVSPYVTRASAMGKEKVIRDALKKDREEDDREERMTAEIRWAEARLSSADERSTALSELKRRWKELSDTAKKPNDSTERRLARRVLSGLSAGITTKDPDYLKIIGEYRIGRGGR